VGIIVRVPLASGLLTGTYHANKEFSAYYYTSTRC